MKTLIKSTSLIIILTLFIVSCGSANKGSKEFNRALKESVKSYEKDNWKPVGAGSLEMYLRKALDKEFALDENGDNKYMVVYSEANGGAYDAVSEDAWSSAKLKIAGNVETYVTVLIKRQVANKKLTQEKAVTISKYLSSSKMIIAQKISISDIFFFRKDLPDGMIRVKYAGYLDYAIVRRAAEEELKKELQNEADDLSTELDEIFFKNK